MKIHRYLMLLALTFGVTQLSHAQAPTGSTGQCKDGSYTNAASKMGACRGHKGVQSWFATSKPATPSSAPVAAKPAPTTTAAVAAPVIPVAPAKPSPISRSATVNNSTPAPGGGPGMVWVNASTNVYHCPTDRYYGKTKQGKYMTEAQAKAAGAHAEHGKGCGQ